MVGRPEKPVDPSLPFAGLANGMRALREKCMKTYAQIAVEVNFGVTALSTAANGRRLPTRDVLLAYVRACGGSESEWLQRWKDAARGGESR
jgi:hypothetical protein